MNEHIITWVLIPILIMFARIIDVSIGTVRIIFVARGKATIAAVLGFFEVIIWILAISQVLANLTNVSCYIGYGVGFAIGNILGIKIEKRIAFGLQMITIVTTNKLDVLPMLLRDEGYGVTTVSGKGAKGDVRIIYAVVERKFVQNVLGLVNSTEPESFVTVEDMVSLHRGFVRERQKIGLFGKKK
ncbi:DUF2179 domain-containing protein [candidate division WOR-3 bacterium]|nr:DUF2179 domain-containing protein [candidate division WOR-3 bacterium]